MNNRLNEILTEKKEIKMEISRLTSKLSKLSKEEKNIKRLIRKSEED